MGGAEFLAPLRHNEAKLEYARGNLAAARQAIREAIEIALATPAVIHWLHPLPEAARLLEENEVEELLERVRGVPSFPVGDAERAEAEGIVKRDASRSREAAAMYQSLAMPYEEARCRIDAGELERARALIEEFGFSEGPLGRALAVAAA